MKSSLVLSICTLALFSGSMQAQDINRVVAAQQAKIQQLSGRPIVAYAEGGSGLLIPAISTPAAGRDASKTLDSAGAIAKDNAFFLFTAPREGVYEFYARAQIQSVIQNNNTVFDITLADKDGKLRTWIASERLYKGWEHAVVKDSRFIKLQKGESMEVRLMATEKLSLHNWIIQIKSVD